MKQQKKLSQNNNQINLSNHIQINQSGYFINQNNLLGSGRYGLVYQAYSKHHHIKIAVKKIPQLTSNNTNIAEQAKRQIDILSEICNDKSYHKNVMKYYHYEDWNHFYYVFTEYCANGTLKEYINKKKQQFTEKEFFFILKSIVEGMIFINKKFIIHRDIKPANILVDENQNIKIADFGISREMPLRDESLTKNMCTPHYGAPQILREEEVYNENCDVWSCGVLMYEIIEKKSIYQKHRPKNKNQILKALKLFQQNDDFIQFKNSEISSSFQLIMKKMLTIDYQKRPAFEEVQKYIEYDELIRKHNFQDPSSEAMQFGDNQNTETNLYGSYNNSQKEKYLMVLKKSLKYQHDKIMILLSLQKKFMNKPFQVLWNVQKYILKYLTVNMFIIKSKQYAQWLHLSLNENMINLFDQVKIKLTEFRFNYRMIAQLLREQKKKVENDIRKYYKNVQVHAQKIEFDYLQRQKERQRLKSYLNIQSLQQLFSLTRQNKFQSFETYHQIYKSLLQLKQYYLAYEHVQALPTFEDKEIYLYMLLVYHYDHVFDEVKYINSLMNTPQQKQRKKINNIIKDLKESIGYTNELKDKRLGYTSRNFRNSKRNKIQSIGEFKETIQNEEEIMKWIYKNNIDKNLVQMYDINNNKNQINPSEQKIVKQLQKKLLTSLIIDQKSQNSSLQIQFDQKMTKNNNINVLQQLQEPFSQRKLKM